MNTPGTWFFVIGSIGITVISWQSLKSPRYHGFYRFFAFEMCLALVAINLKVWFVNPFSSLQIISWMLLIISIVLVTFSVIFLIRLGKPHHQETSTPEFGFEKTTQLVTEGIYHFIRHPMYASLLFLAWGAFFKHPSWEGIVFSILATTFLNLTTQIEEAENLIKFGQPYAQYMQKTKRFIPFFY
jgi:protein-S-isoprenylcysteine O-methyltransferase Ste14